VLATDIHDHGYPLQHGARRSTSSRPRPTANDADWIVTNPPFALAAEVVRTGLRARGAGWRSWRG
jgi:hypothetical protein